MTDKLEPLPYYKWLWRDWRLSRSVARMHYIARGFFRELLDEQWAEGSIPDDDRELAEICGCPVAVLREYWPEIAPRFEVREDGRLVNLKLERLRTELDEKRIKYVESGRRSAASKSMTRKRHSTIVQPSLAIANIDRGRDREETEGEGEPEARSRSAASLALKPSQTAPEVPASVTRTSSPALLPRDAGRPGFAPARPALADAPTLEAVSSLLLEIVCSHPRSVLRSLQPIDVIPRDAGYVLDAVLAEAQIAGIPEIKAAEMILERMKLFQSAIPRSEWRFLKPVEQFFPARDYRLEPESFSRMNEKKEAVNGDLTNEAIRSARKGSAGLR